ncbi:MAG: BadF/BadG/BcrA/BcrD ATPase family protein [Sulfitobacter sp.]
MSQSKNTVVVAADGGGTGCRAAAGTLGAGILGQAARGPGNVHSDFKGAIANLTDAIDAALVQAGHADTPLAEVTAHLGVAGAHSEVEMAAVADALPYGSVTVSGDRATSVRGALGEVDGYVVALGTGTILARQRALEMTTVSGWGFELSDQASGAWLGHQVLRAATMAEDGMTPHTDLTRRVLEVHGGLIETIHFTSVASPGDYAPLARHVITQAKNGDPVGRDLMAQGAAFLARGLRTLGFVKGDLLVLAGGVGPHYADYLPEDLTKKIAAPKGTALDGAFAMAIQALKVHG